MAPDNILSLKDLKEKAYKIKEIDLIIEELENNKIFDSEFIKKKDNKRLNELLFAFKLLKTCFYEKQIITERTQSLIANLGRLRAAIVTKDFCKARKIMYKHVHESYTNLKELMKGNKDFEIDLKKLNNLIKEYFSICKVGDKTVKEIRKGLRALKKIHK
ncbi:hypothetical protein KY321_05565, partial [Candidatus Woesearchaeota archaeon]|nr:hypothetical protein [Candidatus Woesearchaeota archaeon]